MSNAVWSDDTSGDFGVASNWSGGSLPTSLSNVTISTADIQTITFGSGDEFTVNSLTVGADNFDMNGGTMTVLTSASFAGELDLTGGTMTVTTGATFTDGLYQSDGTLQGTGTIAISGSNALTGGDAAQLLGGNAEGALQFPNNGTITIADYTFGGSTQLTNNGTVEETQSITLGDNSGIDATLDNESGASFNIAGDYSILRGVSSASLVNAGTFSKVSGTGASDIKVSMNSTGTIDVAAGTLEFDGSTNNFGGAIEGAGTFDIDSGTNTILSGTVVTVAAVTIGAQATVGLDGSLSYAGTFLNNGQLDLNGFNLTLTGSSSTLDGTIDGSGTLLTSGSISADGFTLGGTAVWQNNGMVTQSSSVAIGDSSGDAAEIINEASGVFDLLNGGAIDIGTTSASQFVNDGILEITARTGTAAINAPITSTGTIYVVSGTAQFDGATNVFGGTIEGTGIVDIAGENGTISSGTAITVAGLTIGASVTLDENLSYAGTFLNSGTLNLNGNTLTLSGSNATLGGTIDGSGTLITSGTDASAYFTVGGTVTWQNSGTINLSAYTNIGDSSGGAAEIINEASGVFNLLDDGSIDGGASPGSQFVNNGTLESTAFLSTISAPITSTGTIDVISGTAQFDGTTDMLGGTIEGDGTLMLAGGSDTIASGALLTVAGLAMSGSSELTLDENLTYAGAFTLESTSASLYLNGNSLTLSGDTFLSGTINSSGTLITTGTTTISGFTLGATAVWQNYGTATTSGTTVIGNDSNEGAEIINEATGIYDIIIQNGISSGTSAASQFINDGTLEITARTSSTCIVAALVKSTGTLDVVSGTVEFNHTGDVFGGTIDGAGTLLLTGAADTISRGAKLKMAGLGIVGKLTLDGSLTYTGGFSFDGKSASLSLNGNSLTLSGDTFLSGTINSSGTLITSGTISVEGFTLGTTAVWRNYGTATQFETMTIGSSNQAAEIINEANGIYDLTGYKGGISSSTSATSEFVNDGDLEFTLGTYTSTIAVLLRSTGTLDVVSGTAKFNHTGDMFGGTIDGDGTLLLTAGIDTISNGAKVTVANVSIESGASMTLGGNLTYAGSFLNSAASLVLNKHSLTLTGAAKFSRASIVGSGTLITKGTTDLEGATFGATVTWHNDGKVYQSTSFNLGRSGATTTKIVNEAGGIFDLIATVDIGGGTGNLGLFDNFGTFEKTAGTGTSKISIGVENSGTIYADSGTLDITGAVTGTGKLKIGAKDVLELGGSVGSKQAVSFVGSGGKLELTDAPAFAATITGFAAKDSIDLSNFGHSASEKLSFTENSAKTNGELVIKDGTKSFSVELFGQYIAADFKLAADGSGSVITYVPPGSHSTTPHLAAAHT
jgi:hypothetical protein